MADTKVTTAFDNVFQADGVSVLQTPFRTPQANLTARIHRRRTLGGLINEYHRAA